MCKKTDYVWQPLLEENERFNNNTNGNSNNHRQLLFLIPYPGITKARIPTTPSAPSAILYNCGSLAIENNKKRRRD
jgi:hypothetical protein